MIRPEPGVIDEDVEPAERIDDTRERALDRPPVGQIELDGGGFPTGGADGADDGVDTLPARPATHTRAPASANAIARSAPIPPVAPVTSATCHSTEN